ncbi:MAG: hypothetical protein NZ781_10640 [Armatimonadetes bacterium]|nr:hypothetical protein [Armatimonadota bacterium]
MAVNDGNLFLLGVNLCQRRYGMAGTPSLFATACSVAIVLSIFVLLLNIFHNRPYVALMKAKLLRPVLLQSKRADSDTLAGNSLLSPPFGLSVNLKIGAVILKAATTSFLIHACLRLRNLGVSRAQKRNED